jgi:adenylate cyclase
MTWSHKPLIDWIHKTGRLAPDLASFADALGDELLRVGAPVWRLRISNRMVHPLVAAVSAYWQRDGKPEEDTVAAHGLEQRPSYTGSPFAWISENLRPLHKSLVSLTDNDHLVFHELAQRGATDYYGIPLRLSFDSAGILVFVTDRAQGLNSMDLERFDKIAEAISPVVETFRLRQLSRAVAEAYLGSQTGARVLGGEITRGHIDKIEAAILMSDIRGWTNLNARLAVEETVDLANLYFETLDSAIRAHGGEILKFMGDGVLAIFPSDKGLHAATERALAAALEARQNWTTHPNAADMDFGVGLHFGEVLYGNVGSERRLDFTVLGQAVNTAARIEALCGSLKEPILFSSDFAGSVRRKTRLISRETLKGLPEPQDIYAL